MAEGAKIRVEIADDFEPLRKVLSRMLGFYPDLQFVGTAATGEEAVRLAVENAADVVVMDIEMPGGGGVEATRRLVTLLPSVRIVAHSSSRSPDQLMHDAGAAAFVWKGDNPKMLVDAIRALQAKRSRS